MTRVLLGLTVLLAVLHELLAIRAGSRGGFATGLRRAVLVGLVLAAAFGGDFASVRERAAGLLTRRASAAVPPVPFDAKGDPLLAKRLAEQTPARPFPAGAGKNEVEAWRHDVVERLRTLTDFGSARADDVQSDVVTTEVVDTVRRTLITFTASDGTRIPAYVLEPIAAGRRAGVLVVPGHGDGARATAGVTAEEYQHAAALALARRGFVTLTPEVRGFGMLAPKGVPTHRAVAAGALESGTSYKAVVVKDLARALTVLGRWPGVDQARLGVAGASLGGELAVLLGVLDERVKVVASQSYGGAIGPIEVSDDGNDESEQTPHGCHTMPGVNALVWQEDWFRLLAPRPVLVTRGRSNTPRESQAFVAAVRPAFAAREAVNRFGFAVEEGGHEFYVAPVARFLEAQL